MRPSSSERSMDNSALAIAESWVYWIGIAKLVAAFLVAAGVAIEFGSDWVARPYEKTIAAARGLELENARKTAVQAQLELARFSAPRSISEEQASSFIEALKAYRGTRYEVVTYPDIPEPASFAARISDLLASAGWVPIDRPNWIMSPSAGVDVTVNKDGATSTDRAAASALVTELQKAGIVAKLTPEQAIPLFEDKRTAIQIAVTFKP
jgi:hypothetical protein